MNKLLSTLAVYAVILASSSAIARPGFGGHPTGPQLYQEEHIERISSMQERMENRAAGRHRSMENLTHEERLEKLTERLTEQGLSQEEIDEKVAQMQDRMEFHASLEGLSDEEKLEAITARMTEHGLSQKEIYERIVRLSDRMSSRH